MNILTIAILAAAQFCISAQAADLCSSQRRNWEMDKNSEALTAKLAECEKDQATFNKVRAAKQAMEEAKEAQERAKVEARQRLPGVKIGMTRKQVLEATNWGEPASINETVTSIGTREQWVYDVGQYLYFTNGRVTAVQRSK